MKAPESMSAAWNEVVQQTLLTLSLRQVECGYMTHRFGSCDWCGAML